MMMVIQVENNSIIINNNYSGGYYVITLFCLKLVAQPSVYTWSQLKCILLHVIETYTINVIICMRRITDHVNNKLIIIFGLILFWFFLVIDSLSL